MEFKLKFNSADSNLNLTHQDSIVTLGSCFSEEMAAKLQSSGFRVENNPFGTLFHPESIASVIQSSINQSTIVQLSQREDLFFAWDCSSKVYAKSQYELEDKVIQQRIQLKKSLSEAKLLIITFGTAWKYTHRDLQLTVGNCHKTDSSLFLKSIASISDMQQVWTDLLAELERVFPQLEVLFTVSPVRHVKDGLIENNRSKARLLELVHSLVDKKQSHYFPAYEILIDELRDYRFYANDLVHPNQLAISYIWKIFQSSCINNEAQEVVQEIVRLKSMLSHKSLHPDSNSDQKRIEKATAAIAKFKKLHPGISWT